MSMKMPNWSELASNIATALFHTSATCFKVFAYDAAARDHEIGMTFGKSKIIKHGALYARSYFSHYGFNL